MYPNDLSAYPEYDNNVLWMWDCVCVIKIKIWQSISKGTQCITQHHTACCMNLRITLKRGCIVTLKYNWTRRHVDDLNWLNISNCSNQNASKFYMSQLLEYDNVLWMQHCVIRQRKACQKVYYALHNLHNCHTACCCNIQSDFNTLNSHISLFV